MGDLLTPGQLQSAMLAKSREVDEALEEFRTRIVAAVEAERKAMVARNAALLVTEGTVAERNAKADLVTDQEIYEAKMAGALGASAKEALRARLAQLSAIQSMATTVREEMRLAR